MVIDNTPEYDKIWDAVLSKLHFFPSYSDRGHSFDEKLPFMIDEDYSVYAIEDMTEENIALLDKTMRDVFVRITKEGKKIYALDWQHSAYFYDPRDHSGQNNCTVKDKRYAGGEYNAYFPEFYPDGDYYFFIEEDFEFGYLGHPWRQEIWVFGSRLMQEIEQVYQEFGWRKLR
ncbi:MAG: DUF2716 domain-containing protein [Ruminococcus sp.]|nr:DUF2716 domain-containing protein [Ruminococcus sp.]